MLGFRRWCGVAIACVGIAASSDLPTSTHRALEIALVYSILF